MNEYSQTSISPESPNHFNPEDHNYEILDIPQREFAELGDEADILLGMETTDGIQSAFREAGKNGEQTIHQQAIETLRKKDLREGSVTITLGKKGPFVGVVGAQVSEDGSVKIEGIGNSKVVVSFPVNQLMNPLIDSEDFADKLSPLSKSSQAIIKQKLTALRQTLTDGAAHIGQKIAAGKKIVDIFDNPVAYLERQKSKKESKKPRTSKAHKRTPNRNEAPGTDKLSQILFILSPEENKRFQEIIDNNHTWRNINKSPLEGMKLTATSLFKRANSRTYTSEQQDKFRSEAEFLIKVAKRWQDTKQEGPAEIKEITTKVEQAIEEARKVWSQYESIFYRPERVGREWVSEYEVVTFIGRTELVDLIRELEKVDSYKDKFRSVESEIPPDQLDSMLSSLAKVNDILDQLTYIRDNWSDIKEVADGISKLVNKLSEDFVAAIKQADIDTSSNKPRVLIEILSVDFIDLYLLEQAIAKTDAIIRQVRDKINGRTHKSYVESSKKLKKVLKIIH